jgi:ferritin
MLNPELEAALNAQLGAELYSSHLYLSMSAYCESVNLPGAARWFRMQADEERTHALKFFDHIVDRGGRVALAPIEGPPTQFASLRDAFEQALQAERNVTAAIDGLTALAATHGDYAAQAFLQWFVTEQVEEESNVGRVLERVRLAGAHPAALLVLDRELGARQGG